MANVTREPTLWDGLAVSEDVEPQTSGISVRATVESVRRPRRDRSMIIQDAGRVSGW